MPCEASMRATRQGARREVPFHSKAGISQEATPWIGALHTRLDETLLNETLLNGCYLLNETLLNGCYLWKPTPSL